MRFLVYLLASVVLSAATLAWLLWRYPLSTLLAGATLVGVVYLITPAKSGVHAAAVVPRAVPPASESAPGA